MQRGLIYSVMVEILRELRGFKAALESVKLIGATRLNNPTPPYASYRADQTLASGLIWIKIGVGVLGKPCMLIHVDVLCVDGLCCVYCVYSVYLYSVLMSWILWYA